MLLVDAVDEIPVHSSGPGSRQHLAELLCQWAEACTGPARCLVTSRLAGYAEPPMPGAREAELLPFTPEDVRVAAAAWDLPGPAARQLTQWLGEPAVAAMARIPLLLALICSLIADSGRERPLPQTRADLYGEVVWQFLSSAHRSASGTAETVSEAARHALLGVLTKIAFSFAATSRGWVDQMTYADLLAVIRDSGHALTDLGGLAPAVLEKLAGQAGELVPAGSPAAGEQVYLFLHRSIAEYLVARHLAQLPAAARMQVVTAHQWFDPDWAEVIPMLGGMLAHRNLHEAQALVNHFLTFKPDPMNHAFCTALRIACEAPDPDQILTAVTSSHMPRVLRRLFWSVPSRERMVRVLSSARQRPRVVTTALLALSKEFDLYVRTAATEALGLHNDPVRLAANADPELRCKAAEALAGREGAEVTAALLTLAADVFPQVRQAAAAQLARREGDEVTAAILTLAANVLPQVRRAAAKALATREGSEVTAVLITLSTEEYPDLRIAAAWALAGQEGAEVTPAVLTLAADYDWRVREAAAKALAKRQGAEAIEALLTLAAEYHWRVRQAAASSLAKRDGAEMAAALLTTATHPQARVRKATAAELAGRHETGTSAALLMLTTDKSCPAHAHHRQEQRRAPGSHKSAVQTPRPHNLRHRQRHRLINSRIPQHVIQRPIAACGVVRSDPAALQNGMSMTAYGH